MTSCITASLQTGDPIAKSPPISAEARIQPVGHGNWVILENGEVRATYPATRFDRFSGRRKFGAAEAAPTISRSIALWQSLRRISAIEALTFTCLPIRWTTPHGFFFCRESTLVQYRRADNEQYASHQFPIAVDRQLYVAAQGVSLVSIRELDNTLGNNLA